VATVIDPESQPFPPALAALLGTFVSVPAPPTAS
jgi:hypothetical protein